MTLPHSLPHRRPKDLHLHQGSKMPTKSSNTPLTMLLRACSKDSL